VFQRRPTSSHEPEFASRASPRSASAFHDRDIVRDGHVVALRPERPTKGRIGQVSLEIRPGFLKRQLDSSRSLSVAPGRATKVAAWYASSLGPGPTRSPS
jgi:hypothetical protein